MSSDPIIFDGHNDALFRLWRGRPEAIDHFHQGGPGHIDLPKALKGGFAGGLFAIFVPGEGKFDLAALQAETYDIPHPPELKEADALKVVLEQAAIFLELESRGHLRMCRSVSDIRAAMDNGKLAAVLHMEGAEAIGPDLAALEVLYAAGLRSIGPVWSRETIFGTGVPFRYPSDGDIGPGLTEDGRHLIRRATELRMVIDLSHLNEKGFWDVADMGVPLVATHSNAHAITPLSRNLTDRQLKAIGETGGLVGLNFATAFLRPDGQMRPEGALEWMPRHLAHMIEHAGEAHVALGSDFDGGIVPTEIADAGGLGVLRQAMRDHGFSDALIERICWRNWFEMLERTWGA
ncbi:peptidase [Alphaproteobacteria bacterium GH1-50]|uniref:Peptidase n=1 Tax=Kangsaoukella pontilimi TaxID=2691042 RepID=A0A7C9MRA2_9RHOB|nr:dipeptidase [Kangsaoukella pontilimi]MXQ08137.1 peptidase [Kangsaoukella pontilimi]